MMAPMADLDALRFPIVQISLDLTSLEEAIATAEIAVEAGNKAGHKEGERRRQ